MDYNQPGPEESSSGVELPSSANFLTSIATVTAATNRDSKTPRASVSDSSANVQCPPSNQNGFATRPPGAQTLEELIGEVRTLRNTASPSDTPTPNGTGAISSTPTPQDGSINPVSQLYELSAIRGITPVFDMIHNGPSGFSVVLTLGVGISVLQEKGPFPSKNIAKYTIARRGCEVVRNLPELKAQKTVIDSSASRSDQENCIGILQERAQVGRGTPTYNEHVLGVQFACTLTLSNVPNEVFRGTSTTKKAAKRAAARDAVRWLRDRGDLPSKGPPLKRKKLPSGVVGGWAACDVSKTVSVGLPTQRSTMSPPSSMFRNISTHESCESRGLPAAAPLSSLLRPSVVKTVIPGISLPEETHTASSSPAVPHAALPQQVKPSTLQTSSVARVVDLCGSIGCVPPTYSIAADEYTPSLYSGAASFPDSGSGDNGIPRGLLGQVRGIYGKRAAKEEIARALIADLEEAALRSKSC